VLKFKKKSGAKGLTAIG